MFSYVDPKIREHLEQSDKLVTLDRQGRPIAAGAQPYISVLGPMIDVDNCVRIWSC